MTADKPSAVDLLRHLERSNCRECQLPTCLSFAAAVVRGDRRISECPRLTPEGLASLQTMFGADVDEPNSEPPPAESYGLEIMDALMAQVSEVDLAEAAARLGGDFTNSRLALRCLGRTFELDSTGNLFSQCHVNPWVHAPLMAYVLDGAGAEPTGEWVLFRELRHTQDWILFFGHRCETELQRIADVDPALFLDLLQIFGGKPETHPDDNSFAPDALVIHPLPRLPVLISYWPAEDSFASKLTLFFDRTAERNLSADYIYRLVGGIVEMLRKIMQRHSAQPA